jgi:hypothetical protein
MTQKTSAQQEEVLRCGTRAMGVAIAAALFQ